MVLVFNAEKESMLKHAEIYFQGFNFGYLSTAFSFIIIICFFEPWKKIVVVKLTWT